MKLKSFIYNNFYELNANTYVLYDDANCVVIDPGKNNDDVSNFINENHLNLKGILLTHGHFDHIQGIANLLKSHNAPIYIHKDDVCLLTNAHLNCSDRFSRNDVIVNAKPLTINDGDELNLLNSPIKVIATPFHTKGSVCFYLRDNKMLFSGDTLFKEGIGRVDFPNSVPELVHDSLSKLITLDKDTTIYPGHGDSCKIGESMIEAYL